ncbi:TRAP transporter small permease [Bordetella petrii]|uniref:TRAP transporter small permease n=1 Tax=Bordetella petrii TaxID=94624 RepID=UPI00130541F5|nr:TRAP transporter small permease [Bordetella petrii]
MLDWLTRAATTLAAIGLFCMMVMVVLDIVLKYVLHQPIPGTLEMVSFYFMAVCAFLPFAYVQKTEHHIVMTLATDLMPPNVQRVLIAVGYLVGAAYLAVMTWASAGEALRMTLIGEATGATHFDVLIWPGRWCVPAGAGLMACWMILQAAKAFSKENDHV